MFSTKGKISELCDALEIIANKNNLTKQTQVKDNTKCYFQDPKYRAVTIGARTLKSQLVIDIEAFNSPNEYRVLKQQIEIMLKDKYSGQYLYVRQYEN